MFRSKYAQPDTPTQVELIFSYGGKTYTVRRNPEYERPAKRGGGTTTQKAEAELILPDGRVVVKPREVNREIVDIIGLDRGQFAQIAMIAQGDFLKLLLADTKSRQEIFREIFKTRYYMVFQERMRRTKRDSFSGTARLHGPVYSSTLGEWSVTRTTCVSLPFKRPRRVSCRFRRLWSSSVS